MILTCPNCNTSFNVPNGAIVGDGRTVRCASCKNSWHATPNQLKAPPKKQPAARPAGPKTAPQRPAQQMAQSMTQPMAQSMTQPMAPAHNTASPQAAFQAAQQAHAAHAGGMQPPMGQPAYQPHMQTQAPYQEQPYTHPGPVQNPAQHPNMQQSYGEDFEVDEDVEAATAAIRRQMLADDDGFEDDSFDHDGEDMQADDTDHHAMDDLDDGYGEEAAPSTDFTASLRATVNELGIEDDEDPVKGVLDEPEEEDDGLAFMRAQSRREAEAKAQSNKKIFITALWGLLILIWVSIPTLLFVFPETLQKIWPGSAGVLDSIHGMSMEEQMKKDTENLSPAITDAPEVVNALLEPTVVEERNGETVLVLRGFVENAGQRAARVPRLKAAILDVAGNILDNWEFDPPGKLISRGQKLRFEQTRAIPAGANQAVIEIIDGQYSQTEAVAQ